MTIQAIIEDDGFRLVPDVIDAATVGALRRAVESLGQREEVRRRGGPYGVRNLLDIMPEAADLARSPELRALVTPVLGNACFAVRGTLFDKNPDANWGLFWHQDSIITVRERRDVPGFGKWAQKAGVWHVEPPFPVFERMLTLRVHLDDCGPDNGPLRVIPGSHRHGWLENQLDDWKARKSEVTCTLAAGGVLVMRPLILHASSAALVPSHRRVLHIEYAVDDLPGGLEWHTRIGV
jgi:ectoine hydroxylase-related dioxygenase (phytanoyl-CoA dioxygenase family)